MALRSPRCVSGSRPGCALTSPGTRGMAVTSSLDKALEGEFIRSILKAAGTQMHYLVKQFKGRAKAAAAELGISRRTVERYVKDQIKKPRASLAGGLQCEVCKRWQPQVRAMARKAAATANGIVIDSRVRFGFTVPVGTVDDARLRHLTVALLPQHAARLFDAQEAGASDREYQQLAADALDEVYFRNAAAAPTAWPWSVCRHRAPGVRAIALSFARGTACTR